MKRLWITTSDKLVAFLEKEIAAGRNPTNDVEWAAFFERMQAEEGGVEHVADVPDSTTPGYIAGSLRDEGINAQVLKGKKPDA